MTQHELWCIFIYYASLPGHAAVIHTQQRRATRRQFKRGTVTAALPPATLQPQPHDDPMADPRRTSPEPAPTGPAPAVRPSSWAKLVDDPLPAILGAVVVVLLGFSLTVTNMRISDANDRITRLEAKMDDRFAAQDTKIEALEEKIEGLDEKIEGLDEKIEGLEEKIEGLEEKIEGLEEKIEGLDEKIDVLDLKLTALIAALEAAAVINANISDLPTATAAGHGPGRGAGATATPSEQS